MRPVGGGPPIKWDSTVWDAWNATKSRIERRILLNGTDWFVWDADKAFKSIWQFHGAYWNVTTQAIIGACEGGPLYSSRTGAGTIVHLNEAGGGIQLQTGVMLNDYVSIYTMATPAGAAQPYNITKNPYFHVRARLPNASDLLNHVVFMGFYNAVNQLMGFIFDITVDANWHFVTTDATGTQNTALGAVDTSLHDFYFWTEDAGTTVKFCMDAAASQSHNTKISVVNQSLWIDNQDAVLNAVRYLDIKEMRVIQDW